MRTFYHHSNAEYICMCIENINCVVLKIVDIYLPVQFTVMVDVLRGHVRLRAIQYCNYVNMCYDTDHGLR